MVCVCVASSFPLAAALSSNSISTSLHLVSSSTKASLNNNNQNAVNPISSEYMITVMVISLSAARARLQSPCKTTTVSPSATLWLSSR